MRRPSRLRGSRSGLGPDPGFIEPCHPVVADAAPSGPDWLFEIKTDGYRAQVHIVDGTVTVYSRRGFDWTDQFAPIAKAAGKLPVRQAVIDGEATVLGATGLPDFQALRRELGKRTSSRLVLHAFDLLFLDGRDLRTARLVERKRALKALLEGAPPALVYVDFLENDGPAIFEHACRLGLEGIVAKRKDAPYRSGRQDSWIKLKCVKSDAFPIVAFVEKLGAEPRRIASLYLGRWEGDRLVYAGKARSGYSEATARELREKLDALIVRQSPLSEPVKKPKATWVRPLLNAEIEYAGITDDGLLRAAVFNRLRDDLAPAPSRSRVPAATRSGRGGTHGVPRENILQLLPDAVAPTKDELIAYWRKVAGRALVHLARRPLKLVRHTHGITFYHRGPLPPVSSAVHQLRVHKREGGEGVRLWVDDVDGLLGLVAIGAVELHPWNATVDDIELADRIVLDLDPGEGVEWTFVVETALAMRDLMRSDGLHAWPKLTGGKGIHLMAPLEVAVAHDVAREYARRMVGTLVGRSPDRYLLSAAPSARAGRIFLDYLRNGRGNTAIGAYSPRVRPGFPIAAPISWRQLEAGISPDAFSMRSPFRRPKDAGRPA